MNETLKKYVCEKCGGDLTEASPGRFYCRYCRTEFFKETSLPDELILDLHSANRERSLQRFEDALNEYDRIIDAYPDCFDAYWGATLSDYGIQYEKDYDGRMIPTVHRFSETPVTENPYFIGALCYCKDAKEKDRIEESALEIERIRAEIKKTVGTQKPYDIFLCYKETPIGESGGFTSEFYWADELYRTLRGDGYKVFFAKQSLPASKGDYEAHIFPALKSAKLMLILTTSVENLESVWVKNEWSRFLRFSRENPGAGKRFKVIQSGFRPENLPRELRKEQVLNHDSMGWVDQLYSVIKDTFRDEKKEAEERRRREAEELEARIAKSSEERIRELEKKLEEERISRFAEEQKRLKEEEEAARKRREDEARKNEERIRELERQLAEATRKSAPSTAPQSSESINSAAASHSCPGCGAKISVSDDTCPACGTKVGGAASGSTSNAPGAGSTALGTRSMLIIGSGDTDVVLSAIGTRKLDVIKVVKEALGLGLKDAKDLVESAPVTLKKGLSKSAAETFKLRLIAVGATVSLKDTATEDTVSAKEFNVVLTAIGSRKLDVISTVRQATGLGLKDAKDLVESAPATVKGSLSRDDALALKTKLETYGASVTIEAVEDASKENALREIERKAKEQQKKYEEEIRALKESLAASKTANVSQSVLSKDGYLPPEGAVFGEKTYPNGSYKGYLLDGKPHGKGVMTYTGGGVYDGEWVNNNITGKGKYIYANGNVYEGSWVNNTRCGYGKFTYKEGSVYEGDHKNNVAHGKGKMIFASGDVYEGDWKEGKRSGRGRYVFANGNVYEGDFADGKLHGHGSLVWNEAQWKGDRYEGDWLDGKRTGRGKYVFANGNVYEGDFAEGKLHGNGKLSYKDGTVKEGRFENNAFKGTDYIPPSGCVMIEKTFSNAKYNGYALNGTPHGKGVMRFNDGGVYEGEYKDGNISGKGKYTYTNGNVYDGEWLNNSRHGYGKFTYKEGAVYEGDHKNNVAHGKGKMTFTNKDVYEGDWKEGKRSGRGKYVFASGNVYEGDFVDGMMHGNGKYVYTTGKVNEGRFENNVFKGVAAAYVPPSGSVMTEKKFTNATYKGYAFNGTPHGKGVMKFNDGAVYDGEYQNGSMHGKGTYVWKNGNKYSGDWYNGKMNGYGVYTYADGRVLNGRFESGVFKGNK